MSKRRTALHIATALCVLALSTQTFAQAPTPGAKYPDRPVKVTVALAAGGSVDMIVRTLGQKLQTSMGQPFVFDNHAGASR